MNRYNSNLTSCKTAQDMLTIPALKLTALLASGIFMRGGGVKKDWTPPEGRKTLNLVNFLILGGFILFFSPVHANIVVTLFSIYK